MTDQTEMTIQKHRNRSLLAELANALASLFSRPPASSAQFAPSTRLPEPVVAALVAEVQEQSPRRAKIIPFPTRAQSAAVSSGHTPLPYRVSSKKLSANKVPSLVMMLSPHAGLR